MKTVFISGADRGVGLSLCEEFLKHGYRVFAGRYLPKWPDLDNLQKQYPQQLTCIPLDIGNTESVKQAAKQVAQLTDSIDILVNDAGISRPDTPEGVYEAINVNAVGAIRMTDFFLPLMEKGDKRLCYVSSEAGSITLYHRSGGLAYCSSKTVLNMALRLMFQELKEKGYTFRIYHPGWVRSYMSGTKSTRGDFEPEESAKVAFEQFTSVREYEDVLLMTDVRNHTWPF